MNRRKLLASLLTGITAPVTLFVPSQLMANNQTGRRLVLVELAGANDGLNTLVPISDDNYHNKRPTIGLRESEVIRLNDDYSIHQALKPLMKLWDHGNFSWVHGLGYPSPNRSHFKSMSLWETGGDGKRSGKRGWLTHDIEHRLGRVVTDAHGISLAGNMNLFSSDSGRWLSMKSPGQFLTDRPSSSLGITVKNQSLRLVTQRMAELESSLAALSQKLNTSPKGSRLPGGELGAQLQQVVRLIRAGIDTPVYRVQLSGFDTHENQPYQHRALLSTLAEALAAFAAQLQQDGEWDNTLVMTYSEFGRRASENKSGGTDHGSAAPHFLLGGSVNGGLYGSPVNLAMPGNNGDPDFTMDYRALYDLALQHWFRMTDNSFESFSDNRLRGVVA